LLLLTVTLLTGLVSGIYPAFYLSSFKPVDIFRDTDAGAKRKSVFRQYLVVVQFVISIALIIGTTTIQQQMSFMQNKSLGFDKENVIVIPASTRNIRQNVNVLREKFLLTSNVQSIAVSTNTPGDNIYGDRTYTIDQTGKGANLTFMSVDYYFGDTYNLEFEAGRDFSEKYGTDTTGVLIVNETAIKKYGITPEEMVTRTLNGVPVIGVVKDFHFKSLHKEVEPLALILNPARVGYISLRLNPGNYSQILKSVEDVWNEVIPGGDFQFSFVDERLNEQYKAEVKTSSLFFIFSSLSIIVACLGLFGLAAFTTEEKTKEIGIRKVLGATNSGIVLSLIKQFSIWVLAANIIAWPLAYYVMNNWLQDFAYRTNMNLWIFIISGLVVLTIALLTVGYQSIKAALSNPVDSLRNE
ncbi:ABC transporter permease, partial [Bacteroidota bacterium]